MAIPLLKSLDLKDKDITADALLTQRKLAEHLVKKRHAHYHFTVKANQATLLEDLALMFQDRTKPHFVMHDPPDHGRIETRNIWTTTALNDYLDFPYVGQAFAIERIAIDKKGFTVLKQRNILGRYESPEDKYLPAELKERPVIGRLAFRTLLFWRTTNET